MSWTRKDDPDEGEDGSDGERWFRSREQFDYVFRDMCDLIGTADRGPVYGLSQIQHFKDRAKTGFNWS